MQALGARPSNLPLLTSEACICWLSCSSNHRGTTGCRSFPPGGLPPQPLLPLLPKLPLLVGLPVTGGMSPSRSAVSTSIRSLGAAGCEAPPAAATSCCMVGVLLDLWGGCVR